MIDLRGNFDYGNTISNLDGVKRAFRDIQKIDETGQYLGFWDEEANQRDGKGVMIFTNGSRYDGYWNKNKTNGRGRLIHADGEMYEGDWLDDKAHGKGMYIHKDGTIYEGDWVADNQEGHGVETWNDGAR